MTVVKNKKSIKVRSTICLLVTSMIWGAAFVAQSVSMDYIEPLTFICLRSLIGTLVLLPVITVFDSLQRRTGEKDSAVQQGDRSKKEKTEVDKGEDSRQRRQTASSCLLKGWADPGLWRAGIVCGVFLFFANCAQQTGIQYTTAGKAGFITAFYIILVPVAGLFFHRKCSMITWMGVFLALIGLYFLCITGEFYIEKGDALLLLCAFLYTGQIMSIDYYSRRVNAMKLSLLQFLVGTILGGAGMLLLEDPRIPAIIDAAGPILYTGVMSTGVAYTLQIIGQKGLNPTVASLIMSLEAVFSVLAGYLFLHEILSPREMLGCVIMFTAIILAQLGDRKET